MTEGGDSSNDNKRPYTKIAHCTEEQKREYNLNRWRATKGITGRKQPPQQPRPDLSQLSTEERQARRNAQKLESKNRKNRKKTMNEEHNLFDTPPPTGVQVGSLLATLSKHQEDDRQEKQRLAEQEHELMGMLKEMQTQENTILSNQKDRFNSFLEVKESNDGRRSEMHAAREEAVSYIKTSAKTLAATATTTNKDRIQALKDSQQVSLGDRLDANADSPSITQTSTTLDSLGTPPKSVLKQSGNGGENNTFMSRLFSSGAEKKKKRRISFGNNVVKEFEVDPDERRLDYDYYHFQVVVADSALYKDWRDKTDHEFIRDFTKEAVAEMTTAVIRQTLHAARVMQILKCLEYTTLRKAMQRAFPGTQRFRRLMSPLKKQVERLLDDDVAMAAKSSQQSTPTVLIHSDTVTIDEKYGKQEKEEADELGNIEPMAEMEA